MAEETNRKMAKYCPELASEYAKYPMQRAKWLDPRELDPEGKPCYIQGPDAGPKPNYVFGPGKCGRGYYHLLTRFSYQILYARLANAQPTACCACNAKARKEVDEYDDVARIVYNRSVASIPNDEQAYKDAISGARSTAQSWSTGLQIEQQAVMFVNNSN